MKKVLVVVGVLALAGAGSAFAATASSPFQVTATVTANCTITSSPLVFGGYDPVATNAITDLAGTSTLSVSCTKNATANIGLDNGLNYLAPSRRMASGLERLNYQLYKEVAHTNIWGNAAPGWVTYNSTSKAPQAFTIYGNVPAGQDVAIGSYADTITATVNF